METLFFFREIDFHSHLDNLKDTKNVLSHKMRLKNKIVSIVTVID